jgi:hypothetical protein
MVVTNKSVTSIRIKHLAFAVRYLESGLRILDHSFQKSFILQPVDELVGIRQQK